MRYIHAGRERVRAEMAAFYVNGFDASDKNQMRFKSYRNISKLLFG